MKLSDTQCALLIAQDEVDNLGQEELYKACVLLANNGNRSPVENHLDSSFIELLNARRSIKTLEFKLTEQHLQMFKMSFNKKKTPLWLQGDAHVIQSVLYQRQGAFNEAIFELSKATEIFQRENETYRRFRSKINSEILECDYGKFIDGAIYYLQAASEKESFHDLVGHIHKARSVELLNKGQFSEALIAAQDALSKYDIQAPDAEDRAVAQCLVSLSYFLLGNMNAAKEWLSRVLVRDGKVKPYFDAINALSAGRIPVLEKSHPLYGTPWRTPYTKSQSITGKLIGSLHQGPCTRDQLITFIWGSQAVDPTYCDRLYSAIKQVRKKMGMTIIFDGAYYSLKL